MELVTIKNFDTLENNMYSYVIQDSSDKEATLEANGVYRLTVKEGLKTNILLTIAKDVSNLELQIVMEENAKAKVFVLNEGVNATIKETHTLNAYSVLEVTYGDLDDTDSTHDCHYDLVGPEANVQVRMAYIGHGENKKRLNVQVEHMEKATESGVEVYGVCKDHTVFTGEIVGHIVNGAHQSYCTQATRVLNFDKDVYANVKPILLIDDNDVKASHACTMGTVDDAHLYYLESRGLTPKEAVSLIVSGYISVLAQIFDDEAIKERILKIVEEKAGE